MEKAAVAVCLCCLLAGCSGLSGGGTATPGAEAATPAPVPTDAPAGGPDADAAGEGTPPLPEAITNGTAATIMPGLTDVGVFGPEALAATHVDSLTGVAHRTTLVRTVRVDGAVRANDTVVTRVDGATQRARVDVDTASLPGVEPSQAARYADLERVYVRTRAGDVESAPRTAAVGSPGGLRSVGGRLGFLYTAFAPGGVEAAVDGYRVESGYIRTPASFEAVFPGEDVRNATFRARIGTDGVLEEYRLSYEATDPETGDRIRVEERLRYDRVGNATVERPDWTG